MEAGGGARVMNGGTARIEDKLKREQKDEMSRAKQG